MGWNHLFRSIKYGTETCPKLVLSSGASDHDISLVWQWLLIWTVKTRLMNYIIIRCGVHTSTNKGQQPTLITIKRVEK